MRLKKEKTYEKLKDWMNIAYSIWLLDEDLKQNLLANQQDKYQENLELLNVFLEMENKVYHSCQFTIENYQKYYQIAELLIDQCDFEPRAKSMVLSRIMKYILMPEYKNPFLSMKHNRELFESENEIAISVQYSIDYVQSLLTNFYSLSPEERKYLGKTFLINYEYSIRYQYKITEWFVPTFFQEQNKNHGREKCFSFQQDEQLVNAVYQDCLNNALDEFFRNYFDPSPISKIEQILNQLDLESLFYLLSPTELSSFIYQVYKNILNNPFYQKNDNFKERLEILKDMIQKNLNNKDLKKLKKTFL